MIHNIDNPDAKQIVFFILNRIPLNDVALLLNFLEDNRQEAYDQLCDEIQRTWHQETSEGLISMRNPKKS